MNKHIMFLSTKFLSTNRHSLSTNRDVGLNLQAELDDARAEIQDLRATNAALQRDLNQQPTNNHDGTKNNKK